MTTGITADDCIEYMNKKKMWTRYNISNDARYEVRRKFVQNCLDGLEEAGWIGHIEVEVESREADR
jgi:DNA topoisomerase VI subunit B